MKTLCHLRIGRKFVPVPNYVGYFYGSDGFQEKKTSHSYAIVISQDVNIATLAYLKHSTNRMTWDEAKLYRKLSFPLTYMPSLVEMLQAAKFKEHLQFTILDTEWTCTEDYNCSAWALYWYNAHYGVGRYPKNFGRYVRPFFKLNVLTGQYEKDI